MITDKGYSRELEYNLQCFNCRKTFSTAWHLDKHLEAGKCQHYTEKRYSSKISARRPKVKMYVCSQCDREVDGKTLDLHLQSGKCS